MPVNLENLLASHEAILLHLEKYEQHVDYNSRLILLSETKKLLAPYFKESVALGHFLTEKEMLETLTGTINHYASETHNEGKKIIALVQRYNINSGEKLRFKFQMDIAEAINLLKHRIRIEKKYFIPKYKSFQNN